MIPEHTDVLVVGGGHAAMCAAIGAAEQGAQVVVLEWAGRDMRGGNSRHTRNMRVMHDKPLETLTGTYSEEAYWQDLWRVTGGCTDERLARTMIRRSGELMDWLSARGVHFQPALRGTLQLAHSNAFFLGGGKALLNGLYRHAEHLGVQICYESEVRELQLDGTEFRGAQVNCGGHTRQVRADAVVVASGGFQANSDWMREVWGQAADNFIIRGTPFNTGTVLRSLLEQGADSVADADQCHAVALDARAPKFDGGIVSRLDCVSFGIVVNNRGQRFYDEGEDFWPRRYAIWGRLIAAQPDQIAYAVVDSKVVENYMPSVFPPIVADSLEELAVALELDPAALRGTVNAFNNAVLGGSYDPAVLDGCGTRGLIPPKSNWALPLDTPPFHAYPLRPGITFTYLGVKVDEQARVHFSGNPADNVFAAGEVMAGNILGQGYCAGTGMTIGGVFGRIAGEQAACRSR